MNQAMKIAVAEWTHLLRTRLAVLTLGLLFALVAIAAINSSAQLRAEAAERLRYQHQADEEHDEPDAGRARLHFDRGAADRIDGEVVLLANLGLGHGDLHGWLLVRKRAGSACKRG